MTAFYHHRVRPQWGRLTIVPAAVLCWAAIIAAAFALFTLR